MDAMANAATGNARFCLPLNISFLGLRKSSVSLCILFSSLLTKVVSFSDCRSNQSTEEKIVFVEIGLEI